MRNNRWNEHTGRGVRVAATVAGALALAGCGSQLDTPVATEELQSMDADYVAFGMLTYVTANGVREARIAADTAYVYENESTAALKQMELIFYDELGKERATALEQLRVLELRHRQTVKRLTETGGIEARLDAPLKLRARRPAPVRDLGDARPLPKG